MATRTVDLGKVIGPQGPQGPRGATGAAGPAGPAGADGMACRTARFVVGTSRAGWTAGDCDYLCDGTADQVQINAAIQALPSGGGEVVLLDGTYYVEDSEGQSAGVLLNRDKVTLRGSGPATRLTCSREFYTIEVSANGCTVRDLYAYSKRWAAINSTGNNVTVLNNELECGDDGESGLTLAGTGGRVIGNVCTGFAGRLFVRGSGHVVMGNRVTVNINTANVTNSIVTNNLTVAWTGA